MDICDPINTGSYLRSELRDSNGQMLLDNAKEHAGQSSTLKAIMEKKRFNDIMNYQFRCGKQLIWSGHGGTK